jgi:hypothetical protein
MKRPIFITLIFLSFTISASEQAEASTESIKDMTHRGYAAIDKLFQQAHAAVSAKKDLMDTQWLTEQMDEIKEIQNILSDATILVEFDQNNANPIPELLSVHVQQKIYEVTPTIFEIENISVKRVQDFYEFSHTMCKLSGGSSCSRIMRTVESAHFDEMLRLKAQKIAREQLRKEEAAQLRDALLLGKRKK